MQLTTKDIGKVYRLNPDNYYWVIDIQDVVKFKEEKYVELTATACIGDIYFGKVLERNIYGCLEKYEIEFCAADVIKEAYSNKEEFNNDSAIHYFMTQSFDYPSKIVDKEIDELTDESIERINDELNKKARKLIFNDKKKQNNTFVQ